MLLRRFSVDLSSIIRGTIVGILLTCLVSVIMLPSTTPVSVRGVTCCSVYLTSWGIFHNYVQNTTYACQSHDIRISTAATGSVSTSLDSTQCTLEDNKTRRYLRVS
ncbi:hypothetical protein F5X97DRAFT_286808 [Nemania serpens]|nr:hypothetical protein F5X97DRAFT_286808 [Nemania serpens]